MEDFKTKRYCCPCSSCKIGVVLCLRSLLLPRRDEPAPQPVFVSVRGPILELFAALVPVPVDYPLGEKEDKCWTDRRESCGFIISLFATDFSLEGGEETDCTYQGVAFEGIRPH